MYDKGLQHQMICYVYFDVKAGSIVELKPLRNKGFFICCRRIVAHAGRIKKKG